MPPGQSERCGKHEVRLENLENRQDKTDVILEKIRNRLPVWATFVFSVLGLIIGFLLKVAT